MSKKKSSRPPIPSKELRAIWAKVPKMLDCQGKCQISCGPIPAATVERKLVEGRARHQLGVDEQMTCNMLRDGRCTVYGVRPLICRIWGTTKKMACPHGCKPERWLSDEESKALILEVEELTQDEDGKDALQAMLDGFTPEQRRMWRQLAAEQIVKWGNDDAG